MDILTVLRTILRRWLVVVPIVVITFVAAFVVGTGTEPEYGMEGTAVLVSASGAPAAPRDASSFAAVSGPVFAETLRSSEARMRLAEAGATVPYAIEVDPATSILRVRADSPDAGANVQTVEIVLDSLARELELLEETAEIPDSGRATVRKLSEPSVQPGGAPAAVGSAFLVPKGPEGPNPYPPSGYTARLLTERILGAEAQQRVLQRVGAVATFSVTQNQRDDAPIIYLTSGGTDADEVERVFTAAREVVEELLDEQQAAAGVEVGRRTRLVPLNTPAGAVQTSGSVVKSVVTVVGLGLIAAATAAIVVESLATSATARRRADGEAHHHDDLDPEGNAIRDFADASANDMSREDLPRSHR